MFKNKLLKFSKYLSFSLQEPATNLMTHYEASVSLLSISFFPLSINTHSPSLLFLLSSLFRSRIHCMTLLIILKISDRNSIHLSSGSEKSILKAAFWSKSYFYYFIGVEQNKSRPSLDFIVSLYFSL